MPMPSVRPTPETQAATCVDVTQATQAMVKSAYVEVNNIIFFIFYYFLFGFEFRRSLAVVAGMKKPNDHAEPTK